MLINQDIIFHKRKTNHFLYVKHQNVNNVKIYSNDTLFQKRVVVKLWQISDNIQKYSRAAKIKCLLFIHFTNVSLSFVMNSKWVFEPK